MRKKWKKEHNGQAVAQKFSYLSEPMYKPKLLQHTPSLRAIRNYNELPIRKEVQNGDGGIENPGFENDYRYEGYTTCSNCSISHGDNEMGPYDYATMGTLSVRSKTSGASELNSEYNEVGSTVKLVTSKVELSVKSWLPHMSTIICTVSTAMGMGNLYRLPQTTIIRGGLPFLVVYIILTLLVGLPLLFLKLGVGQMAQDGFIKSWRAVPFFRGIGYVKLLAGCLLSIYYPVYMALALFYIIWLMKGPIPFNECANGVVITDDGYSPDTKDGQDCLRQTFLKSPLDDPSYFGIYAALLLFVWIIITALSMRKTKSYIRSLSILFIPTMACYIALTTKSVLLEYEMATLWKFAENADWSILSRADAWYYATIQVFFSTNVGFGSFVTNAGIIYNKVNPLWTALGYITANLVLGTGSIIISQILTGKLNSTPTDGDVAEVQLFAFTYDVGRHSKDITIKYWLIVVYALIFFSGCISMATLPYTLLKAICSHNSNNLKWWHWSIILSLSGFILGCAGLFREDFDIFHLLDHYIVGNLILICVIVEVLALITFYGTSRITSDFEFMLGHILSKAWLLLWWFIPLLLTAIFAWALTTLPLEGIYRDDPAWLYGIGWTVVLSAFVFIFAIGCFVVGKQDGYTIADKMKASLEPSPNWGPSDPMQRHNWVQWNSKSQNGEKDFTLKRRGTKEYTKTVKRNAKKAASEMSGSPLPGAYQKTLDLNRLSNNYTELYYMNLSDSKSKSNGTNGHTNGTLPRMAVTSIVDSWGTTENSETRPHHINPLAQTNTVTVDGVSGSNSSEGYGTFRKGPYIIQCGDNVDHVCHRKFSQEEVTEL